MSDEDFESMDKGFIHWDFVRKYHNLREEALHEIIKRSEHKALREIIERPDLPYIYLRIMLILLPPMILKNKKDYS